MTICRSDIIVLFISVLGGLPLQGQDILGLSMIWDGDPTQWKLVAEQEEADGRLETFDLLDARKIFWNYEVYESSGRIWNIFPVQYNQWRLQSDTFSISISTVFIDRWAEWRISSGEHTLTLQAAGLTNPFFWVIDHPQHGKWEMYTYYEWDPRDWEIKDSLSPDIPLEMKVAATFIVIIVNFMLI